MTRQTLETYQVLVYLAAITAGLLTGLVAPGPLEALEVVLWPLLALLLYTTFTQVPLAQVRAVFADRRFVTAAIIGNFLVLPAVVWGLLFVAPEMPAVRLGIVLVLLVPCTDWFITFTHLGGGDTKRAIAFSPVSLLLQFLLLPLYLWLFLGETMAVALVRQEMLLAFGGIICLPLFAAYVTERWVARAPQRSGVLDRLGWFPVPLLALVVFVIATTQVGLIAASVEILGHLLLIFAGFLLAAGMVARALAGLFHLPTPQGRVLAFSLGTRNSFVVLPLALALPTSFELAAVAIVFQSLVELLGMALYLWWVPRVLFRGQRTGS